LSPDIPAHSEKAVAVVSFEVSPEFKVLGADEIKRHPEVETLLVTQDNRTEVMII
jgi:hypothetical protein